MSANNRKCACFSVGELRQGHQEQLHRAAADRHVIPALEDAAEDAEDHKNMASPG